MEKSTIIVLVSALSFLSFLGLTCAKDKFIVEGTTHCATCHIQFLTELSKFLKVSQVRKANRLGFLKKYRLPGCADMLKELEINEDGTLVA
ncbi:hypothetical protein Fmac_008505 [Flemingia macrophylla]|uniref:Uncharacterized protein n=1 Tax=Flemingia macrophylla TaxID=520843 RepID=A0ABD1N003_9FABA